MNKTWDEKMLSDKEMKSKLEALDKWILAILAQKIGIKFSLPHFLYKKQYVIRKILEFHKDEAKEYLELISLLSDFDVDWLNKFAKNNLEGFSISNEKDTLEGIRLKLVGKIIEEVKQEKIDKEIKPKIFKIPIIFWGIIIFIIFTILLFLPNVVALIAAIVSIVVFVLGFFTLYPKIVLHEPKISLNRLLIILVITSAIGAIYVVLPSHFSPDPESYLYNLANIATIAGLGTCLIVFRYEGPILINWLKKYIWKLFAFFVVPFGIIIFISEIALPIKGEVKFKNDKPVVGATIRLIKTSPFQHWLCESCYDLPPEFEVSEFDKDEELYSFCRRLKNIFKLNCDDGEEKVGCLNKYLEFNKLHDDVSKKTKASFSNEIEELKERIKNPEIDNNKKQKIIKRLNRLTLEEICLQTPRLIDKLPPTDWSILKKWFYEFFKIIKLCETQTDSNGKFFLRLFSLKRKGTKVQVTYRNQKKLGVKEKSWEPISIDNIDRNLSIGGIWIWKFEKKPLFFKISETRNFRGTIISIVQVEKKERNYIQKGEPNDISGYKFYGKDELIYNNNMNEFRMFDCCQKAFDESPIVGKVLYGGNNIEMKINNGSPIWWVRDTCLP